MKWSSARCISPPLPRSICLSWKHVPELRGNETTLLAHGGVNPTQVGAEPPFAVAPCMATREQNV